MKNFLYFILFYFVFAFHITLRLLEFPYIPDVWSLLVCLLVIEKGIKNSLWLILFCGLLADFAVGLPSGAYFLGFACGGITVWLIDAKVYIFKDNPLYLYFLTAVFLFITYSIVHAYAAMWALYFGGVVSTFSFWQIVKMVLATTIFAKIFLRVLEPYLHFSNQFSKY